MTDKFRDDQASKPNAGVVKVHESKKDYACPAAGVTEHPEKQVGHEEGTLANPNAGAHETGKDPKNVATPKSGVTTDAKAKNVLMKITTNSSVSAFKRT
jgi:hypothetical protein